MAPRIRFGLLISAVVLITGFTNSFPTLSMESIMSLVNVDRARMGLPALNLNTTLNLAAYARAEDMISNQYFAHVSPEGLAPWYWMTELGYRYSYAGENLAIGYDDATDLVSSWMQSKDHRDNILSPNFEDMGVAVIKSHDNTLVVQLFGTPNKITKK